MLIPQTPLSDELHALLPMYTHEVKPVAKVVSTRATVLPHLYNLFHLSYRSVDLVHPATLKFDCQRLQVLNILLNLSTPSLRLARSPSIRNLSPTSDKLSPIH